MEEIKSQIKFKTVRITPEDAKTLLESSKGNRPVTRKRVLQYATIMGLGQWLLNGQAIILDEDNALADGHGRLEACIEAGVPFETVLIYNVPRSSWVTLDSGKARSAGDVFGIEGITNPVLKSAIVNKYYGLKKGITIASVAGSMSVLGQDFKAQALAIYKEHSEVFDWAASVSNKAVDKGLRGLCTASILGGIASYLVLEKNRERELIEKFLESLVSSFVPLFTSTRIRLKGASKGVERQAILAEAWNKFVEGKETTAIRITVVKQFE